MRLALIFLILFLFVGTSDWSAAQIPNRQWRDHLAYSKAFSIASFQHKVFCASSSGVFYFDKRDQSLNKISKVNGLNDVDITTIAADKENNQLIVAYRNGALDLFNDNTFFYLNDIKRKNILGDKQINNITIHKGLAYLATGFGIVVLDYLRKEIKDTYIFGPGGTNISVNDVEINGNTIYAATAKGVYQADLNNPGLVNYKLWERMEDLPVQVANYVHVEYSLDGNYQFVVQRNNDTNKDDIYYFDNGAWTLWEYDENETYRDFFVQENLLYHVTYGKVTKHNLTTNQISRYWSGLPRQALIEGEDIWAADLVHGLVRFSPTERIFYAPNGPNSNEVFDIYIDDQQVLTTRGAFSSNFSNLYLKHEFFKFNEEKWQSYVVEDARDAVHIVSNPLDPDHIFTGTWGFGIYEYKDDVLIDSFTVQNTAKHTLQSIYPNDDYVRIGGLVMDKQGNLWATNSGPDIEHTISVRTAEGKWKAFKYSNLIESDNIGEIMITRNNHKWIQIPQGKGIFVFDDMGTIEDESDDRAKKLNIIDRDKNQMFNDVYCMAEDLDGDIWVGTNQGPLVYYNPEFVFDDPNIRADRIVLPIEIAGEGSYLLENSTITSIAIDGANRKWIGTAHSGVFLLSESGKKEISHFTKDNSPLFSNQIKKIAINHKTGEVFIATPNGLLSYMGDATSGGDEFGNVYVYPNPIREDYLGDITITGLARDVNVKITDVSGNIVYETTALGGQAIWNGRNFNDERVRTGVYYVFCTSDNGSLTHTTKLLFIH